MRAFILAGGPGTRLRPLTCTKPKLLMPIANRPTLDWTLMRLAKSGVTDVVLGINYMPEYFKHTMGTSRYGIKLRYSLEPKPMGTGGAVKYAEKSLNLKRDEELLIFNGDIFADFDLEALKVTHRQALESHGVILTIVLQSVVDPTRFGVVQLDHSGRVLRFVEKPKDRSIGSLINAGIYLTDWRIFRYINKGRCSIEREVFPKLAEEGRMHGFKHKGFWVDVGKPEDYLEANFKVLERSASEKPRLGVGVKLAAKTHIIHPAIIGTGTRIESGATVGPYVVTGRDTVIGSHCKVERSVLFNNVKIGSGSHLTYCIIGETATLGQNVRLGRGCVLGDHITIADEVKLSKGVQVCPYKEVKESILRPMHIV